MATNKPTSLSYFIKRLHDSGYVVEKVFIDYAKNDPRLWTVIIDPGCASVFCTCYMNRSAIGDNYLEFYDGGQYLPNYKIKTQSVEVLLEHLNKYGIINKRKEYMERGLEKENSIEDINNSKSE